MNLGDLVVNTPGYSVQDLSHTNILSAPFGKVFPVLIEPVHPNETIEVDFDWLCRTFPLNAPLMDNVEIAFDAFWVPYRVLGIAEGNSVGFNFENFFNPANLTDSTQLPNCSLRYLADFFLKRFGRLQGTLYDYLGYDTFPESMRRFREFIDSFVIYHTYSEPDEVPISLTFKFSDFGLPSAENIKAYLSNIGYYTLNANYFLAFCIYGLGYKISDASNVFKVIDAPDLHLVWSSGSEVPSSAMLPFQVSSYESPWVAAVWLINSSFTAWVTREFMHVCEGFPYKFSGVEASYKFADASNRIRQIFDLDDPLGYMCNQMKVTPSELYDEWINWLIRCSNSKAVRDVINVPSEISSITDFNVIGSVYRTASDYGPLCTLPSAQDVAVNILPFMLYDRIIQDWYVNPLLVDGENRYYSNWNDVLTDNLDWLYDHDLIKLKNRLWSFNDPFVTATTVSGQPNVLLPANPSVKDIRNMNRLQLMLERISKSGKRYIDQILTTFGIQPSDARVDRSEVLFRRTAMLDFQTVTQTSQADFGKLQKTPLGMQVGQSTSFQTFPGNTITFDEHGYYVIMCSLRPNQSYFQGINQHLKKVLASQFLVPDFAQIGDQYVTTDNVYCDFMPDGGDLSPYFGYNQRYWEYMYHGSEIHGLMQNELDYYHLGRRFSGAPVLNEQFTSVDSDDNELYRIFTSWDRTPFLMWIHFKEKMLRPLPSSSTYTL